MFNECSVCSSEADAGCCALTRTQMLQEQYHEVMTRDNKLNPTAVGRAGQEKLSLCEDTSELEAS